MYRLIRITRCKIRTAQSETHCCKYGPKMNHMKINSTVFIFWAHSIIVKLYLRNRAYIPIREIITKTMNITPIHKMSGQFEFGHVGSGQYNVDGFGNIVFEYSLEISTGKILCCSYWTFWLWLFSSNNITLIMEISSLQLTSDRQSWPGERERREGKEANGLSCARARGQVDPRC